VGFQEGLKPFSIVLLIEETGQFSGRRTAGED